MENCFSNFIGIRGCESGEAPISGKYIDDLEGISTSTISKITPNTPDAQTFLKSKLEFAVQEYAAYVLSFFEENEAECLSRCKFKEATYSDLENANLGIRIERKLSSIQRLSFTCINVRSNQAGAITITVTDGDRTETFNETLVVGEQTLDISFSTKYPQIEIYANGTSFQFGQIECSGNIGCTSCTSSGSFSVHGYKDGNKTSKAYGFIPDVCVDCDEDSIKCLMIQQVPEGALYFAGVKILDEWQSTDRLNYLVLGSEEWVEMKKAEWAEMSAHYTNSKKRSIERFLRRIDANCFKCTGTVYGYQLP